MRIALVSETFYPDVNGVATTLRQLVQGMRMRGHDLLVVRPRPRKKFTPLAFGYHEIRIPGIPIPKYPEAQIGIPLGLHRILSFRPDWIHVATEGTLGLASARFAMRHGIPLMTSFHTNFQDYCEHYGVRWMKRLTMKWLKKVHDHARFTLVPNQDLIAYLKEQGFKNCEEFGRGVDGSHFSPDHRDPNFRSSLGVYSKDKVILTVSRLAAEKNLKFLIQSASQLLQSRSDLHLWVVGDGPLMEELKNQAWQGSDKIRFFGMQTGDALAKLYASADYFAFSSETETFGNVILEAMSSGLAVVAYDYAAAKQWIRDGQNGFTCALGSSVGWEDALHRAIHLSDEDLKKIRDQARLTTEKIPWSRIVDIYEGALNRYS